MSRARAVGVGGCIAVAAALVALQCMGKGSSPDATPMSERAADGAPGSELAVKVALERERVERPEQFVLHFEITHTGDWPAALFSLSEEPRVRLTDSRGRELDLGPEFSVNRGAWVPAWCQFTRLEPGASLSWSAPVTAWMLGVPRPRIPRDRYTVSVRLEAFFQYVRLPGAGVVSPVDGAIRGCEEWPGERSTRGVTFDRLLDAGTVDVRRDLSIPGWTSPEALGLETSGDGHTPGAGGPR